MPVLEYRRLLSDSEEYQNLIIKAAAETNPVFDLEIAEGLKRSNSAPEPRNKPKPTLLNNTKEASNISCIAVEDSKSSVKLFESGPKNEKTLEKIKFQESGERVSDQK